MLYVNFAILIAAESRDHFEMTLLLQGFPFVDEEKIFWKGENTVHTRCHRSEIEAAAWNPTEISETDRSVFFSLADFRQPKKRVIGDPPRATCSWMNARKGATPVPGPTITKWLFGFTGRLRVPGDNHLITSQDDLHNNARVEEEFLLWNHFERVQNFTFLEVHQDFFSRPYRFQIRRTQTGSGFLQHGVEIDDSVEYVHLSRVFEITVRDAVIPGDGE